MMRKKTVMRIIPAAYLLVTLPGLFCIIVSKVGIELVEASSFVLAAFLVLFLAELSEELKLDGLTNRSRKHDE